MALGDKNKDTVKHQAQHIFNLAYDEETQSLRIMPLDEFGNVDNTGLTSILDDDNDPVFYWGRAATGTVLSAAEWRILRIDCTDGVVLKWADGDTEFNNVWNSRAGLSYS